MRKQSKQEIKESVELTKELLVKWNTKKQRKVSDLICFAKGSLGTGNEFKGYKGLEYIPFEIIDLIYEIGER